MGEDFLRSAGERLRPVVEFPEVFFERVLADGSVRAGDAVLDLHCGGSNVARGLALRGCALTGIDHSVPALSHAAELDRRIGVTVAQQRARVENASFPPASFRAITAAQCWPACERPRPLVLFRTEDRQFHIVVDFPRHRRSRSRVGVGGGVGEDDQRRLQALGAVHGHHPYCVERLRRVANDLDIAAIEPVEEALQ